MPISFGKPGDLRKTIDDGKFDLIAGNYYKQPCPLASTVDVAAAIKDGMFLKPDGQGKWVSADTAAGKRVLIFTAFSERIIAIVDENSAFPGEDRTDTPTGLAGTIEGVWPSAVLTIADGGTQLADYTAGANLTITNGKLDVAGDNDTVIGQVLAPATVVGASSIAARITL